MENETFSSHFTPSVRSRRRPIASVREKHRNILFSARDCFSSVDSKRVGHSASKDKSIFLSFLRWFTLKKRCHGSGLMFFSGKRRGTAFRGLQKKEILDSNERKATKRTNSLGKRERLVDVRPLDRSWLAKLKGEKISSISSSSGEKVLYEGK